MDELTPWEDINPTVSAQPAEPQSQSLARLVPASNEQFRNELTACLALVVPVGMTEDGRREWLSVAWATLSHLPPELLAMGCKKARETCDHPSKIVPAIIAETADWMRLRREAVARDQQLERQKQLPSPDYVTAEQAADILREFRIDRRAKTT